MNPVKNKRLQQKGAEMSETFALCNMIMVDEYHENKQVYCNSFSMQKLYSKII